MRDAGKKSAGSAGNAGVCQRFLRQVAGKFANARMKNMCWFWPCNFSRMKSAFRPQGSHDARLPPIV